MTDVIEGKPSRTPWNRNDRRGLAVSMIMSVVAALAVNGIVYAADLNRDDPAYEAVPFNPPGWFIAGVWIVLFAMWGAARWFAYQTGLAGRRASYWVAALMIWALLYPFITAGPNTALSAAANVASLALALAAASQVRQVSKRAFWLTTPSIAWITFACILGFAALSRA